ncbi:hypothetical protein H0H81_004792 [Sphagnurus paluster]|uniref:HAT C-terminal dimerisation domain-containing protein n=1 Tax=Sphagnurus paluster TaxID=117069 RepID=A0A9P7FRV0_9AGAR|nr:hypothetical protein H0H81_004792 [Sphagnurus paluster]
MQCSAAEPSLPSAHRHDAATNQTYSLERLSNLSTKQCHIVSLPSSSSRTLHGASTSITLVVLPPSLTPAEKAEREKQAVIMEQVEAEKEFNWYIARGLEKGEKLLRYWDLSEREFPLLFSVAMDVLPVQASAVPCKHVFSSSKETITLRRSRLSPGLMEMLQVLKYLFKQDRLDFTADWIAKEEDYTIDGVITEATVRELVLAGKIEELSDLLKSASETKKH